MGRNEGMQMEIINEHQQQRLKVLEQRKALKSAEMTRLENEKQKLQEDIKHI